MHKKNIFFIILVFIFVISIVSLNYFVDPYRLFSKKDYLNTSVLPRDFIYHSLKAYRNSKIDTLVIGSSDTEMLFSNNCLRKYKFNLISHETLSLSNYYEILKNYIEIYPKTKNVFIGINYMTIVDNMYMPELPNYSGKNFSIDEIINLLFSFDVTKESFYSLFAPFFAVPSVLPIQEEHSISFPKITDEFNDEKNNQSFVSLNKENAEAIKNIVELLKNKNINFSFFIPPYHATYLSLISEYDKQQLQVQNLKRTLVDIVPSDIKIIDMAFLNRYTIKSMFEDEELYFYNYNHPNQFFGAKAYRILFENESSDKSLFFILNKDNIDSVIEYQNKLLAEYKKNNPEIVEKYKKMAIKPSIENLQYYRIILEKDYSEDMKNEFNYLQSFCNY